MEKINCWHQDSSAQPSDSHLLTRALPVWLPAKENIFGLKIGSNAVGEGEERSRQGLPETPVKQELLLAAEVKFAVRQELHNLPTK